MKKGLLLLFLVFFLTGCKNINKSSYEQIIASGLYESNKTAFKNKTSQGYSYYLPKGLSIVEDINNNVILKSEKYKMYLYIDGKFGYLEINLQKNNQYLIEIMYNYAKIELIVNNRDIKEMLSYAVALLGTISYNDKIILNMVGEDILNYNENEYNIFEIAGRENNVSDMNETNYENIMDDMPDTDLIN